MLYVRLFLGQAMNMMTQNMIYIGIEGPFRQLFSQLFLGSYIYPWGKRCFLRKKLSRYIKRCPWQVYHFFAGRLKL